MKQLLFIIKRPYVVRSLKELKKIISDFKFQTDEI